MSLRAMRHHKMVLMKDIHAGKVNLLAAKDENICPAHRIVYKYFCISENKPICQDCVILKDCPTEHERVTFERAAKIKLEELVGLVAESTDILKKYKDAARETRITGSEFEINSQVAVESLWKAEQEYVNLIRKTVEGIRDDIESVKMQRVQTLRGKLTQMESSIRDIEKITMDTNRFIKSESTIEVTSAHGALSKRLREFLQSPLPETDPHLSYIKFTAAMPESINIGQVLDTGMQETRWKQIEQLSTRKFNLLHGIDVTKDDDIAVCTSRYGVKVFSRSGEIKHTLNHSSCLIDVAVTQDNKYICVPLDECQLVIFDDGGSKIEAAPILNESNMLCNGNAVTIDSRGKVIVGNDSTGITIYNSDMNLISTFPTMSRIYHLSATSEGEIVASIEDPLSEQGSSVQMMDYSGNNIRTIQPPAEVTVWHPGSVYCWQEEIYVVNELTGNPVGIYRYTSSGDYLGCVTNEVINPFGIALSKDRLQLFVADLHDNQIKIFQRL